MRIRETLFIRFLLSVLVLAFVSSCSIRLRAVAMSSEFSADDDTTNGLLWRSAAGGLVIGNRLDPTIQGSCSGEVTSISVQIDGAFSQSVPCSGERFTLAFTGAHAFPANGVYSLKFSANGSSEVIERVYDVLSVDPATLITLAPVPTSTVNSSVDITGTCHSDLTLVIAGTTRTCSSGAAFSETVPLVLGTNSFSIGWTDSHRNSGTQAVSIVRNAPGVPELEPGTVSAVPSQVVSLTGCSGGCGAGAPTLTAFVTGMVPGVVDAPIPLARVVTAPVGDLTVTIDTIGLIVCERRDLVSGECIP